MASGKIGSAFSKNSGVYYINSNYAWKKITECLSSINPQKLLIISKQTKQSLITEVSDIVYSIC